MSHAGFRVVASVGILTLASACASRESAGGSTTVVEHQPRSEVSAPAARSGIFAEDDSEPLTPASGPPAQGAGLEPDCPMRLRDAKLTAMPAMGGVTFLFTSSNETERDELRRRALLLHDAYANGLGPSAGVLNEPGTSSTIETSVDYADDREGARVEIRVVHQNDVDELRRRLQLDTKAMTDRRRCPALEAASRGPSEQSR